MLPLTVGFLLAGPISGYLSDRYGAAPVRDRRDARHRGQLRPARAAADRLPLPAVRGVPVPDRGRRWALFASPNRAGVMNSLPPGDRGAGGGMNQTFQNSAQVLSIGIFFTLMIARPGRDAAAHDVGGPERPRRPAGRRRTTSPTCRRCRSCSRRSWATTRSSTSSAPTCWRSSAPTSTRSSGRSSSRSSSPRRSATGSHEAFAFAIIACPSPPPPRGPAAAIRRPLNLRRRRPESTAALPGRAARGARVAH